MDVRRLHRKTLSEESRPEKVAERKTLSVETVGSLVTVEKQIRRMVAEVVTVDRVPARKSAAKVVKSNRNQTRKVRVVKGGKLRWKKWRCRKWWLTCKELRQDWMAVVTDGSDEREMRGRCKACLVQRNKEGEMEMI